MTLRTILAALIAAAFLSGCSLPAQVPSVAPASAPRSTRTLESPTPPAAPLAPTDVAAPTATAVPRTSHRQLPDPAPSGAPVPPSARSTVVAPAAAAPTLRQPAVALEATPQPTVVAAVEPVTFSGEQAWEHVQQLAVEVGSRPSDSDAQRLAAEYLRDQFTAMGYVADLEPYSFSRFSENASQLVVEEPDEMELESRAIVLSGAGSALEQLLFVGIGRPSDFPAGGLEGRIALIERGQITFEEKVANAIAAGASAAIVYNNQPGSFPATLRTPATVPAVAIAQSDGEALRDLLRQGPVVAKVSVEAATDAVEGRNVVASGPLSSDRKKVVIGAHYDSVQTGPGANDNASGVGTMLEIARVAQHRAYPFDIVFVAFGDEEVGLIGSNRHVEGLSAAQRDQILAMINLDMVGVGERILFGGTDWLTTLALESARSAGHDGSETSMPAGMSSDHASFISAGIPSVFFYRPDDPNYHTARDTAQMVLPEMLEPMGEIALELLERLSSGGNG